MDAEELENRKVLEEKQALLNRLKQEVTILFFIFPLETEDRLFR